jgi:hypothetical protein
MPYLQLLYLYTVCWCYGGHNSYGRYIYIHIIIYQPWHLCFFCTILAVYSWAYQPTKNAIRKENININCWTTSGSFLDHPLLRAESPSNGYCTTTTYYFIFGSYSIYYIYLHSLRSPTEVYIARVLGTKGETWGSGWQTWTCFFLPTKNECRPGQMWYKPQTNVEKEPKSQFQKVFGYSVIFTKQMYTHMIPYGRLHEIIYP